MKQHYTMGEVMLEALKAMVAAQEATWTKDDKRRDDIWNPALRLAWAAIVKAEEKLEARPDAHVAERDRLRAALLPFAAPHAMGDNYVQFSPQLIADARAALARDDPS